MFILFCWENHSLKETSPEPHTRPTSSGSFGRTSAWSAGVMSGKLSRFRHLFVPASQHSWCVRTIIAMGALELHLRELCSRHMLLLAIPWAALEEPWLQLCSEFSTPMRWQVCEWFIWPSISQASQMTKSINLRLHCHQSLTSDVVRSEGCYH